MAAIVTDQFRILNASNFIDSIDDTTNNSYYVFLSLPNPTQVGFGRSTNWDDNTPAPSDSFNDLNHVGKTMMFGKKVTAINAKRVIRRINWTRGTRYEMYRHDYSGSPLNQNLSPVTGSTRLYDSNYYVLNSDYKVYICISNGSSGINTTGNASQDEPTFTDLEPSKAGESGDGYVWKYLFSVTPSDIIKFDSTEYISLPNSWESSTDSQIAAVRDNANSDVYLNQIKKVYIDRQGENYSGGLGKECDIIGDGTGAKVVVDVVSGKITDATVSSGGSGYSYGLVDLGDINGNVGLNQYARLIPIIPPSKGHGHDLYKELGADKVLVYARFDDSTKDFPIDTKFAQVGILKNPTSIGSTSLYTANEFSSLRAIKFSSVTGTPSVGDEITQLVTGGTAKGYVASYDSNTMVLKYFVDRTLTFNQTTDDQTDYIGISTLGKDFDFESSSTKVISGSFQGSIHTEFSGITTNPTGSKLIDLGVEFTNGLANSEINKGSGDIIYLDNRPLISRNSRQKEDVKIILEF